MVTTFKDSQRLLYSIGEVAKLLGVSPITVRKWIKQGKIHAIKLGRKYAIPATEIDKIIDRGVN